MKPRNQTPLPNFSVTDDVDEAKRRVRLLLKMGRIVGPARMGKSGLFVNRFSKKCAGVCAIGAMLRANMTEKVYDEIHRTADLRSFSGNFVAENEATPLTRTGDKKIIALFK